MIRAAAVAAFLLASCSSSGIVAATPDYVIFDASKIKAMLDQCSRQVPPAGDGSWTPGATDIAKFEAALPAAVAPQVVRSAALKNAPKGYGRQYVGITAGGHRLIYGNFFPLGDGDEFRDWRSRPIGVCDGGVDFFGAEFDVGTGKIVHIAFNGDA